MDVLPIPLTGDLTIIIPGALRQPHVSLTFSMTPDEYNTVWSSAAAPYIAERDAANLIRDRAVMERTEALEQLAATIAQIQQLNAINIDNAALITELQQQLADGTSDRLRIVLAENDTLSKQLTSKQDLLESANRTIAGQQRTNQAQSDMLKEALAKLAKYEPGTPPLPTVIPGDVVPGEVPVEVIGDLPGFATYLVDEMGNGKQRTAIMTGYIDKLVDAGIKEFVMLCNGAEIDDGTIPEYLAKKNVKWWADTFRAVYDVQTKKTAADLANPAIKVKRDYFGETVKRCDSFKAHLGYVLDDVHSISPAEFNEVVTAIRQVSSKPIIASFGVLSDLTIYLPWINKHKVFVARQLYRQDKADERLTEKRTDIITTWLKKPGMICHVANLEYFEDDGGLMTSGDDLRQMYNRCIQAGLKNFMGYAAVDSTGFKIWEYPDLWQAFKDCNAAYPEKVKVA